MPEKYGRPSIKSLRQEGPSSASGGGILKNKTRPFMPAPVNVAQKKPIRTRAL